MLPAILHLRDVLRLLPTRLAVARMLHAEFWQDVPDASPESLDTRLALAASPDALPLCRVALEDGLPAGVANLIDYDDPNPRVGTPWLAGLLVVPHGRRRGLGSRLVEVACDDARRLGHRELFLGTDGPGFYARLGACVHRRLRPDFRLQRIAL